MAATNKQALIEITEKEFVKLSSLISSITDDVAMKKDDDGTSIKDVIGHRAHWIILFLGWYEDGLAGKDVFFPAKGYKWNQLKQYNAALRDQQMDMDWSDAVDSLRVAYASLIDFIKQKTDAELYSGPMKGAKNDWTPGRWAEAAGPSHFRSAAKYIRSALKTIR